MTQSDDRPDLPPAEAPDTDRTFGPVGAGDTAPPATPPAAPAEAGPEDEFAEPGFHLVEPDNPLPAITADDLPPAQRDAVVRMGWTTLTPVQSRAIPYVMAGRDVMVQSKTGSGKTAAFVLPILARINPAEAACQAMVLVPTRELAQQVFHDVEKLGAGTGVRSLSVYGGVGYGPQLDGLRQGAHIVVGTPGRILDHLLRGTLKLNRLQVLVFDEADRMLSMGFYPDMVAIHAYLPHRRTGFMFSATYPPLVRKLAAQFLDHPGFLSLSTDVIHVEETTHICYEVPPMDKDRALIRIIEFENPEAAIIFCNTKMRVNYVATVLQRFGYDADQLSADLGQAARDQVLQRLRDRKLRFLVSTDLAGRGIDILHLSHVFNYEVPEDPEAYIHRTGRTGRAGGTGTAISLVSPMEGLELVRLAKKFKIPIETRPLPDAEDVERLVTQRLTALLEGRLRQRDKLQVERMRRFLPLARSLAEGEDELALLTMVLDDAYQAALHAPLAPPEEAPKPRPALRRREADAPPREGGSDRRRPRRRK
ncbi:MAG TPA: DEAD/DEAH box helicase [Acidobacteriota bacterium]|nr:DEAD/DEAH box helicase [Acidobacteriota bacterium]HQM64933.1 DEAD/DEAH box helicase [Acidobacteriota bacterium]